MNFSIFTTTKFSFEGQLPDERTVKIVRMHWFLLAMRAFSLLIAAVPLIVMLFLGEVLYSGHSRDFAFFLTSLFFLFWWYWLFYIAMIYYLNIWIITDHRLIASLQTGLFRRKYAELNIAKIQDISVDIDGVFNTFLNFGNIEVQSAGAEKKLIMTNIAGPMEIKEEINKAYNRFVKKHPKGKEGDDI